MGLDYVCRRLSVAPAEAYGVASFYDLFALEPRLAPSRTRVRRHRVRGRRRAAWRVRRARASGCASGRLPPFVVEAGETPFAAPLPEGDWDAAWSVPQRGEPGLVLLGSGRRRRSRVARVV